MAKIQRKSASPPPKRPDAAAGPGVIVQKKQRAVKVRTKLLVQFTVQLATLQNAGLPIVRCLRILAGQQRPGPFRDAVAGLADDVEGGDSLSVAMAKHPSVFDALYLNMVKAGEAAGILDQILERLAIFAEKADSIRTKIRGALAYPTFVMLFAAVVVVFVMVVVIPRFQEIFTQLDSELPPLTRGLLGVAEFFSKRWWVLLFLFGAGVIGFKLALRAYKFRRMMHGLALRFPLFGGLFKKTVVARFARTLGTLLSSGVPILEALSIVRASIENLVVGEALDDVHRNIKQGEPIARPLAESGVFDDIVVNMVDVGEASGNLDQMLIKIADAYEREVDGAIDTLFKIIEPMILLVLAVVVGTIVVALFMPILKVMDTMANQR